MSAASITPGQVIESGAGFAPFDLRPSQDEDKSAVPPSFPTPGKAEVWLEQPSVDKQRVLHPETLKVNKTTSNIFDLSNQEQFKAYNELLQRTDPFSGDVQVLIEERQFSEKTDNWKVFIQYRTYLFKRIAPKKDN